MDHPLLAQNLHWFNILLEIAVYKKTSWGDLHETNTIFTLIISQLEGPTKKFKYVFNYGKKSHILIEIMLSI